MGLDFHKNNQPQIILCQRGILKGTNSALLQSCCCCCSIAKLYPTCDPMNCQASLSFTISQSLLKFISIEQMMSSNHLILCCPLLLLPSIFPSLWVFSNMLALCFRWPTYWSFSFSISLSHEYSGLISCRTDRFDLSESSPTPQFKSISSLALSLLYVSTLTSIHDYWKKYIFDYMDLCWQNNVSAF